MRVLGTLALLVALPLAGCQTDGPLIPNPFGPSKQELAEQKAELAAKETCRGYGAKPGTDIYIQCRMTQQQSRDAADNAVAGAPVIVNNNNTSVPASDAPRLRNCYPISTAGGVRTVCN